MTLKLLHVGELCALVPLLFSFDVKELPGPAMAFLVHLGFLWQPGKRVSLLRSMSSSLLLDRVVYFFSCLRFRSSLFSTICYAQMQHGRDFRLLRRVSCRPLNANNWTLEVEKENNFLFLLLMRFGFCDGKVLLVFYSLLHNCRCWLHTCTPSPPPALWFSFLKLWSQQHQEMQEYFHIFFWGNRTRNAQCLCGNMRQHTTLLFSLKENKYKCTVKWPKVEVSFRWL